MTSPLIYQDPKHSCCYFLLEPIMCPYECLSPEGVNTAVSYEHALCLLLCNTEKSPFRHEMSLKLKKITNQVRVPSTQNTGTAQQGNRGPAWTQLSGQAKVASLGRNRARHTC